jgi:hypothetical protein
VGTSVVGLRHSLHARGAAVVACIFLFTVCNTHKFTHPSTKPVQAIRERKQWWSWSEHFAPRRTARLRYKALYREFVLCVNNGKKPSGRVHDELALLEAATPTEDIVRYRDAMLDTLHKEATAPANNGSKVFIVKTFLHRYLFIRKKQKTFFPTEGLVLLALAIEKQQQ